MLRYPKSESSRDTPLETLHSKESSIPFPAMFEIHLAMLLLNRRLITLVLCFLIIHVNSLPLETSFFFLVH